MKAKEGGKAKRFILFFMFLIMSLSIPLQSVAALPTFYSNPKTHYDTYGTEIQYMSNHEIAFAGAILQGTVDIRTRIIGYTATVTANGQTAKVIYKRGNSNMTGWDEASPGFTVNKTTVGENTYLLYRVKYANFQDDVYEDNKTLGTYLARGDYDVRVKFDAITEVYSSDSGKTLDGPNDTKTESRDALTKFKLEPTIWDNSYGMMMDMSKADLPVVNFVSKSLTLPSTGAYQSGSTYYVQPGRQISVSTTYKSNIVNNTRQILKLGDPVGYDFVNDYIGAFEYPSQEFVEDDPGTIDFKGGTGSTASNANKNATVRFNFALKDSARNWTAFGEAYNARGLYAGGFKRSYETLYDFVSDGDSPRVFRIPSSEWTNQNVTFNIGVSDNMIGATSNNTSEVAPGSGLDSTTLFRGTTAIESFNNTGGRISSHAYEDVTVSSTTSFRVTARDNVGNTVTENFTVNIDKAMPNINLNYDSGWNNGNVPIAWSASDTGGSGVKDVVLPNGTITTATNGTFTATSSGTYRFIVTDNAGNVKVEDIVVKMDTVNPTIDLNYDSSWNNGNVPISWSVNDTGGSGVKDVVLPNGSITTATSGTFMATTSGTQRFIVTDNAGNMKVQDVVVKIDGVNPTINLNYDSSWSNGNVPISWSAGDTGGSGLKDVVLPNGTITTATSGTYTATTSGTQRFIVTDNAGNIKVQDIVVNIDRNSPTATKSQTPTSWTNDEVTLNLTGISDSGGSGLLNIVKPNGSITTGTSASETVYANGTYTFEVNDRAGNLSSFTFSVTNIDKNAPNGTVSQTPTGYTPSGVTISLTNATDTGGSGVKGVRLPNGTFVSGTSANQSVTANGTYTFQVEDNAGNITNKSITVSNITSPDSTPPTGSVTQTPTSPTNGNVTLNLTNVKDTGGSGLKSSNTIKLPNGTFVSGTSASQVVSANGTYVFEMYDNEGNVGTASVTVSNIDKTPPTASISQSPTVWTNDDVTLTLSAIADSGGSGLASVTMPDGTTQTTFTNKTYTVTANGTYTFKVEDKAGNETTRSITVSNIDRTNPTGTVSQTPTGWTDGNVTLNLTGVSDSGGSGFKQITLPNGTTTSSTSASQVVTTNGTYSFKIEDNAGNITTRTITVSNIDKTAPIGTLTQTPTTWTNGSVTLNLSSVTDAGGSGFKQITLPDGNVVTTANASHAVTTNGSYTFTIEDNAGNVTNKTITVTNIDKTSPTASLTQTPTTWTNGTVTLNLTGVADSGGSGLNTVKLPNGTFVTGTSASYAVSANGTYSFELYDKAGNMTTKSITVSNIDQTDPKGTVTQTPTTWTNGSVTLNLTGVSDTGSGFKNITLPNGTVVTTTSASQVVTSNGTYTFKILDNAGNEGTQSITVTNIDDNAPTGTVSQTPTNWTNGSVTLNLTGVADTGGSGFKQITLPNGTVVTAATASQVVTANGTYTFQIEDKAGNITSKTITVTNIDKTAPSGTIIPDITSPTTQPVTLKVTGSDSGSGIEAIELLNGNYTGRNLLENSKREVRGVNEFVQFADISPIIKKHGLVPMTISFDIKADVAGSVVAYTQNGSSTEYHIGMNPVDVTTSFQRKSITVTPSASSSLDTKSMLAFYGTYGSGRIINVKNVKIELGSTESDYTVAPEDVLLSSGSKDFTFTDNGTYSFKFEDKAGNQFTKSYTISNIDKTNPTGTLTQTPTSWTNGSVTLNLSGVSDTGSGIKNITLPNGTVVTTPTVSQTVNTNGTYTFKITDNAGNVETKSITVSNIDKTAPTGTLTQTPTAWTNGNVTLNLTGVSDSGSGIKNITLPNGTVVTSSTASQVVTVNGTYTFTIEDNAGNSESLSISVTNIDKVKPSGTAQVIPGTTALTIQFNGTDSGSGVESYILPNGVKVTGSTASYATTTPGTYTATVLDRAGNTGTISITIQEPTATIQQEVSDWTNRKDYKLIVIGTPKYGSTLRIQAPFSSSTWNNTNRLETSISENGSYSFVVSDGGIFKTLNIDVTNFDRAQPMIDIQEKNTTTNESTANVRILERGDMK